MIMEGMSSALETDSAESSSSHENTNRHVRTTTSSYLQVASALSLIKSDKSVTRNGRYRKSDMHMQQRASEIVESDGSRFTGKQVAPGQSSTHIMFGDHWKESYRVGTFKDWSPDYPVDAVKLASAGFYYSGYKDRVQCFSCGIAVHNWIAEDDPFDIKWHGTSCEMANGTDATNVPLHLTLLRTIFKESLSAMNASCSATASSYSSRPCGLQQHHSTNYSRQNSNYAMAESTSVLTSGISSIKLLEGQQPVETRQLPEPVLQLAPVHSAEHEQFLFSGLDLTKESDRRKTFYNWPSYPAPLLPGRLAQFGFFYLGNLDRTQCFSCSCVLRNWSKEDDPRTQHQKLFPTCRMVTNTEIRNLPMTVSERNKNDSSDHIRHASRISTPPREPADPNPEELMRLAQRFPCINPANPDMYNEEDRITSFNYLWPANKLKSTPREIAKAGFFFLGQEDRAKCFYCNGGLQNWDENDEPWTEHAKWFPGCEFVLRRKGIEFVRRLKEENPNLNRPTIRNSVSIDIASPSAREQNEIYQASSYITAVPRDNEAERAEQALAALRAENLCKKCYKEEADHLCLPCSHFALCFSCQSRTAKCPVCQLKINSCLKVFKN